MKVVVQRVLSASVHIDGCLVSEIGHGLMILVGVEDADNDDDINWLVHKLLNLRIFNDAEGVMNLSVLDVRGDLLVVSQFTLHASTKKGMRPSYLKASKPDFAVPMYEKFVNQFKDSSGLNVKTGVFGADMKVNLTNDGPVTIVIDTKNKE